MFTQTDYDKLKQIMAESPEKQELLSRLLESHRTEISVLSHEIRNPLTLVYSTLQLLESAHPEVKEFRHWDTLRGDIEYMNELLNELSSYNNGERLSRETIDTENFLKSIVLSFAASLTGTSIEFISQIMPGLPDISADRTKLRQVILNLLKNAREAVSCCQEQNARISFRACTVQGQLLITVADSGTGISAECIQSIFEPFVTYKQNGTGLGLPIARRIVNAHNGSLTVSSEPGAETIFSLTLPVQ